MAIDDDNGAGGAGTWEIDHRSQEDPNATWRA